MQNHTPATHRESIEGKPAAKCPFARFFGPGPASLADALRERTKEAHTRAERHPVQARLVKGEASRAEYAAWLGQMLHVWIAVDATVGELAVHDPRVAAMVKPWHAHAARVAADLAFLDHGPAYFPATRAAAAFSTWLRAAAADKDAAVVGAWYVLEGSANGGRFIAKAVSRALGIAGPEGLTALDPHGELQRERWAVWKADLDAQPWRRDEQEAIIAAAERTFDAVREVMEDLDLPPAVTVVAGSVSAKR